MFFIIGFIPILYMMSQLTIFRVPEHSSNIIFWLPACSLKVCLDAQRFPHVGKVGRTFEERSRLVALTFP